MFGFRVGDLACSPAVDEGPWVVAGRRWRRVVSGAAGSGGHPLGKVGGGGVWQASPVVELRWQQIR